MLRTCLFSMMLASATSGCERRAAAVEGSVTPAEDTAAIRKLFDAAVACNDRYHCPPLNELQERAARPRELRVLEVAFDIMTDPQVALHARLYTMAWDVARAWCAERSTHGHKMSIDDERELRKHALRLVARPEHAISAHGFLGYLSDARQVLEAEAINPARNDDEVASALRSLRDREPDLTTVTRWLSATAERTAVAGALLLDMINHDKLAPQDEIATLLDFARRPDSVPAAARLVAHHAVNHDDPAFAPVVAAFAKHGDASVREAAASKQVAP